jgi:hypothetical protein
MKGDRATGPGRVLRAGLLLPLLAGVLAMHVLLLCSDGGGTGPHGGHGSAVSTTPPEVHAQPAAHAVPVTGPALLARVLPTARDTAADPTTAALAVCLAVLTVALVLGAGPRGSLTLPPARSTTGGALRLHAARPPPVIPLRLLLSVSRT